MDQNLPKSYKITVNWKESRPETHDVVRHNWVEKKMDLLELLTTTDSTILVKMSEVRGLEFDSNWTTLAAAMFKEQQREDRLRIVEGDKR